MAPDLRLLREHAGLLTALALASLALGLLWTTQAFLATEGLQEVRRSDPWSERGVFTYDGLGQPGVLTLTDPILDATFAWTLEDAKAERVTALGTLGLRVEAPAAPGQAAWAEESELSNGTLDGSPTETLRLAASVDLPALERRLHDEHPLWNGEASWALVGVVRFTSAPNDAHGQDASAFVLPFTYSDPLYVMPPETAGTITKDHSTLAESTYVSRLGGRGILDHPLGPALLAVGLVGLWLAPLRPEVDA